MIWLFEFLTPFILGGHNFFNFNIFLTIFNVLVAPIGGVKFFLDTRNNGAFSLDLVHPECLSDHS
jgi:hypothetical protein